MPGAVRAGRWTAERLPGDEPITVFLIGMRINRWWRPRVWIDIATSMRAMRTYLAEHPDSGMLASHQWLGRTTVMLSYWRSQQDLTAFAADPALGHLPVWRRYNRTTATTGQVGVWHETYQVVPGGHEVIYVNMPPFGLGSAVGSERITSATTSAGRRLARG